MTGDQSQGLIKQTRIFKIAFADVITNCKTRALNPPPLATIRRVTQWLGRRSLAGG